MWLAVGETTNPATDYHCLGHNDPVELMPIEEVWEMTEAQYGIVLRYLRHPQRPTQAMLKNVAFVAPKVEYARLPKEPLVRLLKRLEFVPNHHVAANRVYICPVCKQTVAHGHKLICELAQQLKQLGAHVEYEEITT